MKTRYVIQSLLVASLATLSACGGKKGPVVPPGTICQGAVCTAPTPTNLQGDYLAQSLLPQMQQQYGNIVFLQPVQIMGQTLNGSVTWIQAYTVILNAARASGCMLNTPYAAQNALASLNYNCFQSKAAPSLQIWSASYVQFQYLTYSNQLTTAFNVINWFLGTGSSYSQQVYYPQYGSQYNPYNPSSMYAQQYGYANIGYSPYWGQTSQVWNNMNCPYAWGQYQSPYYASNGGFYLNLSMLF